MDVEEGEFCGWDKLIPEALGAIFNKCSLEDKLVVIPRVCKSWERVVNSSICWQQIKFEYTSGIYFFSLLKLALTRSCRSVHTLSLSHLVDGFGLTTPWIADCGESIRTLELRNCGLQNIHLESLTLRLSNVTHLDLSDSVFTDNPLAIEAFGKNCKNLTSFVRLSPPKAGDFHDAEALAIAATMPRLKRLVLALQNVTAESVLAIVASCSELEFLDIQGCLNLVVGVDFIQRSSVVKTLILPRSDYYVDYSSSDSDRASMLINLPNVDLSQFESYCNFGEDEDDIY